MGSSQLLPGPLSGFMDLFVAGRCKIGEVGDGRKGRGRMGKRKAEFPCLVESPRIFWKISRSWKVLENDFGPGES